MCIIRILEIEIQINNVTISNGLERPKLKYITFFSIVSIRFE